ncbi:hypothetical protein [Modestobacter versicolor]|uniref:hypothetical protein n=1 Tax=Modestobacter versicolor TaxID=429133 RepID=UPI0034DF7430
MLIDCDTCTVRGQGCDDCVVTVLLGAPPGWRGSDPTVVPLTRRPSVGGAPGHRRRAAEDDAVRHGAHAEGDAPGQAAEGRDVRRVDTSAEDAWSLVDLDEVERRAVQALADFGLVPPLRHQDASMPGGRHVS